MMITLDKFRQMMPGNRIPETWHPIATEMFQKYQINTVNRISGFMAQTGHESNDFTVLMENLNYSWERLRVIFSTFFPTDVLAKSYHRQPEKIANFVYDDRNPARRNKLGNTKDGDGWLFRGAGLIQLTGRSNLTRFGASIGMTPEQAAEYARTPRGAFESACWFWNTNNLNSFADRDDIVGMSRRVNGGDNGLQDRVTRYARNKQILSRFVPSTNENSGGIKNFFNSLFRK